MIKEGQKVTWEGKEGTKELTSKKKGKRNKEKT
jgi:hypothetical protein